MSKLDLLKKELDINNFPYEVLTNKYENFFEVLCEAIYLEPHENKGPFWGIIFSQKDPSIEHDRLHDYKKSFCNGKRTFGFFKRNRESFHTISFHRDMLDLDLLNLCTNNHTCIIRKEETNIKIYYDKCIYICENRAWKVLGEIDIHLENLKKHYSKIDLPLFRDILRFSFYELSINKIGATIIYWLEDVFNTEYASMSDFMELDFKNSNYKEIIKSYLYNNDGALVLNINGIALGGQAQLTFTEESRSLIHLKHKGTRHNSAARFSYDNSKAIVVTISEDGPVSVFSEGLNIVEFSFEDPTEFNRGIHQMTKEVDGASDEYENIVICSSCGKSHLVNVLTVYGFKERERENCSLCNAEIYSAMCFTIKSRLIKTI